MVLKRVWFAAIGATVLLWGGLSIAQQYRADEFFQLDQSGRPREFLLDPAPDAAKNYWSKVEDLAYDIHNLLKKIHQPGYKPLVVKICINLGYQAFKS